MSIFHKNMLLIYGTLEPIFILHFCDISTIIINVNRRTLHDSICTLMYYLYSPQKSHQLPPDGSFTLLVEPVSEQFHQKQYYQNRDQYRCQER